MDLTETGAPARASAGLDGAENAAFLFEMIVSDTHRTSMQVATFCLTATFSAAPGARWTLRAGRHLLSNETPVIRQALRHGSEIGLADAVQDRLDKLYASISNLQKRTAPLAEAEAPSELERDGLQRLLPRWRKLALTTARTLSLVEPIARARLNPNYVADSAAIRDFLRRVAKTEVSGDDRFVAVQPPLLRQRRLSPRAELRKACRVVLPEGEFPAELIDLSREGMGLVIGGPIQERQKLAVVFDDGRRFEATVSRLQGEEAGLRLATRLPFTDPLFRGE